MRSVVFILALILLTGCQKPAERDFAVDEPKNIYCVGTMNFSLPKSWDQVPSVSASFEPHGVGEDGDAIEVITKEGFTISQFQSEVAARIAQLKEMEDGESDVVELREEVNATEFIIRVKRIGKNYSSESHKLIGGTYLRATVDSYNGSYAIAEKRLAQFLRDVRVRDPASTRGEFCIGALGVGGDFARESAMIDYRSTSHKDVLFSIDFDSFREDESETLFDRVGGEHSLLKIFGVGNSVIRKREVPVSGMTAQEWLSWMPDDGGNSKKHLLFVLETRRDRPSRGHPSVNMQFETGRKGADGVQRGNSYSEEEAVSLWDSIVKSINFR